MKTDRFIEIFAFAGLDSIIKPEDKALQLLSADNPREAVQALEPLEFFELVHDLGLEEANELIALAATEQVQTCLDLDLWRRDSFNEIALLPWIDALMMIPDEDFLRLIKELDPEIIAFFLKNNIQLFAKEDPNEDVVIPNEEDYIVRESPDFTYWIAYPDDAEKASRLQALVEKFYQTMGVEEAWSLLETVHWELPSDLEEKALHFRSVRLEELGFPTWDEAMSLYRRINIESEAKRILVAHDEDIKVGHIETNPSFQFALEKIEEIDLEDNFLKQVLRQIHPIDSFKSQLIAITNAVAIAEGNEAYQREAYADALEEALSMLNIGLEYLSQKDDQRAATILKTTPARHIFTFAYNLTQQLKEKLNSLLARNTFTIIDDNELSLLEPHQLDIINGLRQEKPRPQFSSTKPFKQISDIEKTARIIADLAFYELFFFGILNKTKDELARIAYENDLLHGVESVSFITLALTFFTHLARNDKELWTPFNIKNHPSRSELLAAVDPDRWKNFLPENASENVQFAFDRFLHELRKYILEQFSADIHVPDPRFIKLVLSV